MTAKQALIEGAQDMTEAEASELLAQLEWDATEFEELTRGELAELREIEVEVAGGDAAPAGEVFRRLGL